MTAPPIVTETEEQKTEREKKEAEEKANQLPITPPISEEAKRLLGEVLGETKRENASLKAKVDELLRQKNAPPEVKKSDEERKADFYKDPMMALEEVVKKVTAPLTDFVTGYRTNDEYARIKNEIKNDPRFAPKFAKLEPVLDGLIKQALDGGAVLSPGLVYSSVLAAIGLIEVGNIPGVSFREEAPVSKPENKSESRPVITPPHLAPSTPPQPRAPEAKTRDLTENEKRLAREMKLTPEQYIELQQGDVMKLDSFKTKGGK